MDKFPLKHFFVQTVLAAGMFPFAIWSHDIGASQLLWDRVFIGFITFTVAPIVIATLLSILMIWFGVPFSIYYPRITKYVYWFFIPLTVVFYIIGIDDTLTRLNA